MITSNPGVVDNEQRRKRSFVVRGTGSSQGVSTTTYSKRILLQNSGVDFVYSSSLERYYSFSCFWNSFAAKPFSLQWAHES